FSHGWDSEEVCRSDNLGILRFEMPDVKQLVHPAPVQEKSVRPSSNKDFENPDIEGFHREVRGRLTAVPIARLERSIRVDYIFGVDAQGDQIRSVTYSFNTLGPGKCLFSEAKIVRRVDC